MSCTFIVGYILYSTGERRFGFPEPPIPFSGIRNATEFGAPCPQQATQNPPDFPFPAAAPPDNMSEDCMRNQIATSHTRAYEVYRSFCQCYTSRKYFKEETPSYLCRSMEFQRESACNMTPSVLLWRLEFHYNYAKLGQFFQFLRWLPGWGFLEIPRQCSGE